MVWLYASNSPLTPLLKREGNYSNIYLLAPLLFGREGAGGMSCLLILTKNKNPAHTNLPSSH